MRMILAMSLMVFSAQAFSQNKVQELLSTTEGSPYEILKEFHHSAGEAVALTDINSYNLDSGQVQTKYANCARVDLGSPYPVETVFYSFSKDRIVPGTPARGPLFPGTPETRVARASFSLTHPDIFTVDPMELELMLQGANVSIDSNLGTVVDILGVTYYWYMFSHVEIKKHDGLLSFYATKKYDGSIVGEEYGYCWN